MLLWQPGSEPNTKTHFFDEISCLSEHLSKIEIDFIGKFVFLHHYNLNEQCDRMAVWSWQITLKIAKQKWWSLIHKWNTSTTTKINLDVHVKSLIWNPSWIVPWDFLPHITKFLTQIYRCAPSDAFLTLWNWREKILFCWGIGIFG